MKCFINFLPPWVETNIQPAFYDKESGTCLQQTARMYAKVNQLVRKFNELAEKFSGIENYFENLDVQEEINNKLDEMAEDGSLIALIKPLLDDGYYNESNYIGLTRIMRELVPTTNNPNYSSNDYYQMQGGCYIGENIFVQCCQKDDSNSNILVRVVNLSTGLTERSAVLQLQHANSVTYNSDTNELYITSLKDGDGTTQYIYIINYATLTLTKTIDLSEELASVGGVHSIGYDPITKKTVICVENGSTANLYFYYIDMINETLSAITLENYHNLLVNSSAHRWFTNDICVYDNILYILKPSPNCIVKMDLSTGKCVYVYNVKLTMRYGVPVGELESISYDGNTDDIYIGCTHVDTATGWYKSYNYCLTNLAHGVECNDLNLGSDNTRECHVDPNSTALDPTGTSSKPYKTIGEALECLNQPNCDRAVIYLEEGEYPFVNITTNKDVEIRPVETEHQSDYIVHGIKASGAHLFITSITIENDADSYDLALHTSTATVTSCLFGENKNVAQANVYNTKLTTFYLLTKTNNTPITIRTSAESILDFHEPAPSYTITNLKPTFINPLQLVSGYSGVQSTAVAKSYAGKETVIENGDNILFLWLSSQAGYVKVPFKGSTSTKSTYLSCVSGGNLVRLVVKQDVDAKTISIRTQSVIGLTTTTPTDEIGNVSFSGSIWAE